MLTGPSPGRQAASPGDGEARLCGGSRQAGVSCPLAQAAARVPLRPAIVLGSTTWTYHRLSAEAGRWASWLRHRGLGPGDRVALTAVQRPSTVALLFGAARIGAAVAVLHSALTEPERRALLERLGAPLTLESSASLEAAEAELSPCKVFPAPRVDPAADWLLLFTSGTSGQPKAARLSLSNLVASAHSATCHLSLGAGDAWLDCLAPSHVGSLAAAVRAVVNGSCLHRLPRFDAVEVAGVLQAGRVSHVSLVPTMLRRVLEAAGGRPFRGVRGALVGGAACTAELLGEAWRAGLPAWHTYGLTEASSQVATERPLEADGRSSGRPLPGVQVRIVDAEIWVRGPTVTAGYWNDAQATSWALSDGWLRTGDLGELDERGRLHVHARREDLIVVGGENVYPAEVEAALAAHPEVREAAVFAVPDDEWGQVPLAAVVARSSTLPQGELLCWARARLARFKVPRRILQVEALPRTATGKLRRGALAGLLQSTGG